MTDGTDEHKTDFWDTNLVLGYIVEWDQLDSPVDSYLHNRGSNREMIASTRVFDESRRVVEKQRQRARKAADRIFEDFSPGRYDTVDDVKGFIRAEFTEDWEKVDPTLDYIDYHSGAFLGLTETDSVSALRSTFDEIENDFQKPKESIQQLRRGHASLDIGHFEDGLDNYEPVYDDAYRELDTLLDDTDRDLLLESYHAVNVAHRPGLAFLTFDYADIVNNDDEIEPCLPGVSIVGAWQFS